MNIKLKYQLEGGMGHKLYEIYRSGGMGQSNAAKEAASVSRAYYAYFRGMPDLAKAAQLRDALVGLLGFHAMLQQSLSLSLALRGAH